MPNYVRVTYSPHATDQMLDRKVTHNQVVLAIAYPDNEYVSKERKVAERLTSHGNTIRVVYTEILAEPSGTEAHVITVVRMSGNRMKKGRK